MRLNGQILMTSAASLVATFLAWASYRRKNRRTRSLLARREGLLAVASHDLKGPLCAIQIGVDVLRRLLNGARGPGEVEQMKARLDAIEHSVEHALALVESLLDENKAKMKECDRKRAHCPRTLIEHCLRILNPVAERKGAVLGTDVAFDEAVECDGERITQVVCNLVLNAIQHAGESSRIIIGNKLAGREMLFFVSDNGGGIDKEEQAHLFDLFWRGREARAEGGSGMGLCIAKNFVEMHGGRIWVQSEEGHGSTFYFTLPRRLAAS
jgi:signal transduction histidine kinase